MLRTQTVNLPFAQGLDTKSDPFQIPLGKLLVLQNAVFTSPGKLRKRNGYTALTTSILGGGSISSGTALFTRQNELCMVGGTANGATTLYSYDSSNTAWASKGAMPSVTTTASSLAVSQYSINALDMAQAANGLQCSVYELYDQNASTKQGLGYSIVDSTTGQIVVAPTTLDATATSVSPHVVVLGTNFVVYYIQGDLAATAGIFGRTLPTATPLSGWSAATQLTSGTTTSAHVIATNAYNFDACVSVTNGYVSFNNRSNGTTVFQVLSATPTTVNASTNIAATNSRASCVFPDASGDIALGYITATTSTVAVFDSTLGVTRKAATSLDTTTDTYTSITGTSTAANTLQFFIGVSLSANVQRIRAVSVTSASYNVGAASTLIRSVSLGGRAFTYNSAAYVPAWFCVNSITTTTSQQNTVFLLDASGNILSRALAGAAGCFPALSATTTHTPISQFYQLANATVSGSTAIVPQASSVRLADIVRWTLSAIVGDTSVTNTFIGYQYGAVALTYNFGDSTGGYVRAELANTVHTNGGALRMYDGGNVVEHGFMVYPYVWSLVANGSGGSLSAGKYSYIVTYEWMDLQGQIHKSTPSVASAITTVNNDKVTVTIPTLRLTNKTGVLIQVYRTAVNGTTYYQLTNFNANGSLFNDKTVDTVTWVDTLADASITSNPQIYTTGNVLQNGPCAPAGPMCVHRNRLFVVDSTNPTQIWYSKQVFQPAPVEFSGYQVLNIDPKGGGVTALASLDDKLIVFKKDRIFMVLGQGPDVTGGQNDFTDAMLVSADAGCTVPKSVAVVPDGIMFQSGAAAATLHGKGVYQLSRALQMSYIGAPLEGTLGTTLWAAAMVIPDQRQILMAGGPIGYIGAPYDYYAGQWGTWTTAGGRGLHAVLDGCITTAITQNSNHALMWDDGLVWQDDRTIYVDPGTIFVIISVKTGWIKLDGLQGFQRVRKASVLGSYYSPHTLNIVTAVDYKAASAQTSTFTITSDATPYQYGVHIAQQKCGSVQFAIVDSGHGGTGQSFDLSGLQLEIGVKGGLRRLPAAQTA